MSDENRGRLLRRSLTEEYEPSKTSGGLCLDPHDPAFLGTLALGLGAVLLVAMFKAPTVVYPPAPTAPVIINN